MDFSSPPESYWLLRAAVTCTIPDRVQHRVLGCAGRWEVSIYSHSYINSSEKAWFALIFYSGEWNSQSSKTNSELDPGQ